MSCTSTQGYLIAVIKGIRAIRHGNYDAVNLIDIKQLAYGLNMDALENKHDETGERDKVADGPLDTITKMIRRRDVWRVIEECLAEIKRNLLEALSPESTRAGSKRGGGTAEGALRVLTPLITEKAHEADRMAPGDPPLARHIRRYDTATGAMVRDTAYLAGSMTRH